MIIIIIIIIRLMRVIVMNSLPVVFLYSKDLIGPSHLRVPQKPVRRKFHPDNPEVPPPSIATLAPPTKPPQK